MNLRTIYESLQVAAREVYEKPEADAVARVALEWLCGATREDLTFRGESEPIVDSQQFTQTLDELRRARPIQYITGRAWFDDYEFEVTEQVLIPRPETEELVRWVHTENIRGGSLKILDIGTGSGCIAVSLAAKLPLCEVWACDISREALAVAQRNAERIGTTVHFFVCDILHDPLTEHFDVIVSNPPYVLQGERAQMRANVLDYEPHTALFVPDDDPLRFYRQIARRATQSLRPGGQIYFEINEGFSREVAALLRSEGFTQVQRRQDLFDRDRMISAVWS